MEKLTGYLPVLGVEYIEAFNIGEFCNLGNENRADVLAVSTGDAFRVRPQNLLNKLERNVISVVPTSSRKAKCNLSIRHRVIANLNVGARKVGGFQNRLQK